MLDPRLSVDWIFLLWCCVSCLNFFTEISFPSKLNANFTFLWAKSGKPWWNFYIAISFDLFEIIWILAVDWARLSHLQEIFTEKPYLIKHIPKFRCFAMDIVMLPPPPWWTALIVTNANFTPQWRAKQKSSSILHATSVDILHENMSRLQQTPQMIAPSATLSLQESLKKSSKLLFRLPRELVLDYLTLPQSMDVKVNNVH